MKTVSDARTLLCGLCAAVLLAGVVPAVAQVPDEFTNLEVLPKDIGKRELIDVMRNFAGALGVRCSHCHVTKDPDSLEGADFAADDRGPKKIARGMMKMVQEINGKLLPASGRHGDVEVRCVTCHRGVEEPESLDRILLATAREEGANAAVRQFKELKAEYYGKGSYSFGPAILFAVAEALVQEREDLDGAIEVLKLNLEVHPDAAYSHVMLGHVYHRKGDTAAAIESFQRSLQLEPDNERVKQLIEALRESE